MSRFFSLIVLFWLGLPNLSLHAQTMQFVTSSNDYEVTNIFGNVDDFDFVIEIDAPLAAGLYNNPSIVSVSYRVSGELSAGTPSGFEAFALERDISGEEFYAQGSSLRFEISDSALLDDGVQIAELTGTDVVFRFDGREIDNGRFHPAFFELRADGSGSIQNTNNVPTLDPLLEIETGSEYINNLFFDAGNTTVITGAVDSVVSSSGNNDDDDDDDDGFFGIGVVSLGEWLLLVCLAIVWAIRHRGLSHTSTASKDRGKKS